MAYRTLYFLILVALGILIIVIQLDREDFDPGGSGVLLSSRILNNPLHVLYQYTYSQAAPRKGNCNFYTCFDILRCNLHNRNIKVHIYPLAQFYTGDRVMQHSTEFLEMLDAIYTSEFYTPNPDEACVFIPSVDTLSLNFDRHEISSVLSSLPYWDEGTNHLIFNLVGNIAELPSDKAMIASSTLSTYMYRPFYDISLPFYVPENLTISKAEGDDPIGNMPAAGQADADLPVDGQIQDSSLTSSDSDSQVKYTNNKVIDSDIIKIDSDVIKSDAIDRDLFKRSGAGGTGSEDRPLKLLAFDTFLDRRSRVEISDISDSHEDIILSKSCQHSPTSPHCYSGLKSTGNRLISSSKYCFVSDVLQTVHLQLFLYMQQGCVPVILQGESVLPFSEVLDWDLFSIRIRRKDVRNLANILDESEHSYFFKFTQLEKIFTKYMKSPAAIALTTLQILNSRIFTKTGTTKEDWNLLNQVKSPLFLDRLPRPNAGFTAVILAYNRVDSLFQIIQQISKVPSVARILVIWNHQTAHPPPVDQWPKVNKQMKVIQTPANLLSNRFYPYTEIETEAVFSLDDDITMLTPDEIEYGFHVWREFPDRLVGFPSRLHLWNQSSGNWNYDSEWRNQHSMILTGAAFYSNYWNFVYTGSPGPGQKEIRDWVDRNMNCEDIAFNFMVANITQLAPIKIGPRKKYRCVTASCENGSMLSQDSGHLARRTECIQLFASVYGTMPLKGVEFRVDPLLFKDNVPDEVKKFSNIGAL